MTFGAGEAVIVTFIDVCVVVVVPNAPVVDCASVSEDEGTGGKEETTPDEPTSFNCPSLVVSAGFETLDAR